MPNDDANYKFVVDFEDKDDVVVSMGLMRFMEKLEVCKFAQLYYIEHWFSDIVIIEYSGANNERKK